MPLCIFFCVHRQDYLFFFYYNNVVKRILVLKCSLDIKTWAILKTKKDWLKKKKNYLTEQSSP